jgi:hypothetical protein
MVETNTNRHSPICPHLRLRVPTASVSHHNGELWIPASISLSIICINPHCKCFFHLSSTGLEGGSRDPR